MRTSKSIIVKNQFTTKNSSRNGSTPVNFVKNYMLRNDATLTVYPVSNDKNKLEFNDPHNVLQMQTKALIKRRKNYDPQKVTPQDWFNLTTLEGRGFDNHHLSLSKDETELKADKMQQLFNEGHTIHKLVISFDNDYLKGLNVEKGPNFKTDVDEMKLRLAISDGMRAMADAMNYSNPLFIGTIQLDRDHPHAHIVLAETESPRVSEAKRAKDGSEYGIITRSVREKTFNAIDRNLEMSKDLSFMPSDASYKLQNTYKDYVKNYETLPIQTKMKALKTAYDLEDEDSYNRIYKSFKNPPDERKTKRRMSEPTHLKKAPLGVNFALNNLLNRMFGCFKRKKKHKKACEKETKAFKIFNYFKNLSINHPQYANLINDNIMPYAIDNCINSIINVDKAAQHIYRPVRKLTTNDRLKIDMYNQPVSSPLINQARKDDMVKQALKWHQSGKLNANDIFDTLNGKVPKPRMQAKLTDFKLLDTKNSVKQAVKAAKRLPQNNLIIYDLAHKDVFENEEELIDQVNKPLNTVNKYRTLSTKDADELLFD